MENVHARKKLLVTNVILLNLATMTSQIQKNENATVDVTSKETNVTNVIQNIMVSQCVMPVSVMKMVPWMISVMKAVNVHVKKILPMTNAVNVVKVSLDIQTAKDVLTMQRDLKILLV